MRNHGSYQIQTRIQAARHAPTGDNPHPAQPQVSPFGDRLPSLHALPPRIAALARNRLPPAVWPLAEDERVLVQFVAEVEARVIHDVILLHDVRLLELAAARSLLADDLHLGVIVRMRRGGHALQHAGLGQDEGARADGHEGALFRRVGLLQGAEGFEEGHGLGFGFEHGVDAVAAGDDEDVVVVEGFVGVFVVNVGFDGEARGGGDALGGGGDGAFEGSRA